MSKRVLTWNTFYTARVHTDEIRAQTSDTRMIYEYIRVTYEYHTCDKRVHMNDIRTAYK